MSLNDQLVHEGSCMGSKNSGQSTIIHTSDWSVTSCVYISTPIGLIHMCSERAQHINIGHPAMNTVFVERTLKSTFLQLQVSVWQMQRG